MMSPILFAACVLAQTGTPEYQEPGPEINWTTSVDVNHYFNSKLSISRLLATPEWKQEQEHPPLSARKAIAIARAIVDRQAPYGKDVKLASPTLKLRESNERWFWVVYFAPHDWRRFHSTFPIVVLMDGTAVEPKRIPPPPPRLGDE
jgi:hypothetical protein